MNPEFLSVEQLAERYGVPIDTVYRWRFAGTAPKALKIGKHLRFRWADVLEWEEQQEC
jgi:excisionase family DNA binding protein